MDKNNKYNKAVTATADFYNEKLDNLLLLCRDKQITFQEIANALGVSRQAVHLRITRIPKRLARMEASK